MLTKEEELRYWLERNFVVDLLKQLPSRIFWKNKDCVYLGCNDAFAQSLGLTSPQEIIGKTDYNLPTTKEESDAYRADDFEVMRSRQAKLDIEESQTLSNGTKITLLTSKVPLLDSGGDVIGVLGIYSDITERKKTELALKEAKEQAEAADLAKTMFIANMSHDIRTPISRIIGLAEMLKKEGDSQKDRELGQIIQDSGENLLTLLNAILSMISIEEIKDENLHFTSFNLIKRIHHIQKSFHLKSKSKNINFQLCFTPDFPKNIIADRSKIERILFNLIDNALKFTNTGRIKLSAQVFKKNNNEVMLELSVSDTGLGIAHDQIDKIFDRFYRISPSYEGKYQGFGIGLFIVKKMLDVLKGNIDVQSELGKGTTFTINLPIEIEKHEIKNLDPICSNTLSDISSFQSQYETKILFIEDDAIARMTGQHLLEANGFKVETALDGEEGLKKAKSAVYDLIVTDIGLPGLDGIEVTLLLRRWEKQTAKSYLPIIGLSAHVSDDMKEEATQIGMNLMLEKPLNEGKIKLISAISQKRDLIRSAV